MVQHRQLQLQITTTATTTTITSLIHGNHSLSSYDGELRHTNDSDCIDLQFRTQH